MKSIKIGILTACIMATLSTAVIAEDTTEKKAMKMACSTILNKLVVPMVDYVMEGGFAECVAEVAEPIAEFEVACNAALDVETLGAGGLVCAAAGLAIGSICGVVTVEGVTASEISKASCNLIP